MAYNTGTIFDNVGRLIYGDGSDGTLTFDGTTTILGIAPATAGSRKNYTLTRDITAENITVNSAVDILPNGYRIYVRNKLTIQTNATINMNGGNANGSTAGPGYVNLGALYLTSVGGGAGKTQNGSAQAGTAATAGPNNVLVATTGGSGGAVTGGAAGSGGTSTTIAAGLAGTDYTYLAKQLFFASTGKVGVNNYYSINGGVGGGGGAIAGSTGASGGGGAGGGGIIICTYELDNSGTISANGGNGGNATGDPAGGGGGGGGGYVSVVTRFLTKQGTITANGGTAGSSVNASAGATNGPNGYVNILRA